MHIQLKFDVNEAEWYGELMACPTMPAQAVFPGHRHKHNAPLSVIVAGMKQFFPELEVAIDHDNLIAYRTYKAMRA